jgi:hypothetical protein
VCRCAGVPVFLADIKGDLSGKIVRSIFGAAKRRR